LQETYHHLYNGGTPASLKPKIALAGEMEHLMNADAYTKWRSDYLE